MTRFVKKVAAVGFGLLVAATITEGVVRWTGLADERLTELQLYQPHHHLGYVIAPRAPSMAMRGPHNSLGFRGPEPLASRPSHVKRIACVGGSTTYGTQNESESHCWPRQLETLLRGDGYSCEVLNCGVPAYNSADSLQCLREQILCLGPDIVIFYMGSNDVIPRFVPGFRSDYSHFRKTWARPADRAKTSLLTTVVWLERSFGPPNPPIALRAFTAKSYDEDPANEERSFQESSVSTFQRNLRSMVHASRGIGATPVLATQSIFPAYIDKEMGARAKLYAAGLSENAAAVRAVAAETGAQSIDLETLDLAAEDFIDFHHHSDAGALRIGRSVANALVKSRTLSKPK